jgi:PAS domain S-box-containing protein
MAKEQENAEIRAQHVRETEQLNLVLSLMGEGLVIVHEGGAIALANQAAGVLVRTAPEEIVGELFTELFPFVYNDGATDTPRNPAEEALEQDTIVRVRLNDDWYCMSKDGQRFPVTLSATPFAVEDQRYVIVLFHDVTQEKEIDKAKTEFVSLASHQLKTPLSSINWFTEMLLAGDAGHLRKKQREYLKEIVSSSTRMTRLVNELLNVSRLELGTFLVEPEATVLPDIARDVLKELTSQINEKGHTITEEYQEGLPQVAVDRTLTRMILQNLISNAVKYTPDHGNVRVSMRKDEPNLVIEIADSGLGIPAAQQEKIFTKFFRADNAIASEMEGTGLGLYILKAILEQTKGSIRFTSEEGKGTTFIVTIPLTGMPEKKGTRKLG